MLFKSILLENEPEVAGIKKNRLHELVLIFIELIPQMAIFTYRKLRDAVTSLKRCKSLHKLSSIGLNKFHRFELYYEAIRKIDRLQLVRAKYADIPLML